MTCKVNADTTDGLKLTSDTSGEIDLQTNGTTKVHMDSSGNVGIGTSSPAGLLSLETNNPNIRFDDSDTSNNGEITLDNTALRIEVDEDNTVASSKITFVVDGSERMRILNNVLMIGETSFPAHVPTTNGLRLYLEGGTGFCTL